MQIERNIMLQKQTTLDRIEILSNQTVVARYVTSIMENSLLLIEQASANYSHPGDDYSQEDAKVQSVCALIHTPEVITAYKEAQNVIPTP